MSFCSACGADMGTNALCPQCRKPYGASAESVGTNAPPPPPIGAPSVNPQTTWSYPPAAATFATKPSLAAAVLLVVGGALGAISTFLPFVKDDFDSLNGWKSQEALGQLDKFSGGVTIWMIASIVAIIVGGIVVSNQNSGKASNRQTLGTIGVISAIVVLVGLGSTYNSLDTALRDGGIALEQGAGVGICGLGGLVALIGAIMMLASPKYTQGKGG